MMRRANISKLECHLVVLELLENMDHGSAECDQVGHDREKNGQNDQEDHANLVKRSRFEIRGLPKEDQKRNLKD